MKLALARAIAHFVFAGDRDSADRLACFPVRDWRRMETWLDSSGLALHLIHHLNALNAAALLPPQLDSRLQQDLADGEDRVRALLAELARVNDAFHRLGLPYAMHKGLNLSPDFCPDPRLRLQLDFDFYVRREDYSRFDAAVRELGYQQIRLDEREAKYDTHPGQYMQDRDMYRPATRFSLELHLDLSYACHDQEHRWMEQAIGCAQVKHVGGLSIPALSDVHQMIDHSNHMFAHASSGWVRPSWLLEWLTVARTRRHHDAFWSELREVSRVGDIAVQFSFASALAAAALSTDFPEELNWTRESLPPSLKAWIHFCGAEFALAQYPGSKLYLLVASEFSMTVAQRQRRLVPIHRPTRYFFTKSTSIHKRSAATMRQNWMMIRRLAFHICATYRYLKLKARWSSVRSGSVDLSTVP